MKNRKTLEHELSKVMHTAKHDKHIVESVKEFLSDYGVSRGKAQRILTGDISIEEVEDNVLCLLTFAIYNETNLLIITPYKFFSPTELNLARKTKIKIEDNKCEFPLHLLNAQKENGDYLVNTDSKSLINIYNSNLLLYDYQTQKNYALRRGISGSAVLKSINIDQGYIRNVSEKMLNNEYTVKPIVLSVLNKANNELHYSENDNLLTIHESEVYIVSGLHDINAMIDATEINHEFNVDVEVAIKYQTESEFKNFVGLLNLKGGVN